MEACRRPRGTWLDAGVYLALGQSFNLGIEARYSDAEVTLFNVDAEAGGTHAGVILGYRWRILHQGGGILSEKPF